MRKVITCLFLSMVFFTTNVFAGQKSQKYIKNIYVEPVTNDTNQSILEANFTTAIIDEIMADGRLSFVNNRIEAKGIIVVVIKEYVLQPLTYDDNDVPEQHKLSVVVDVSLIGTDDNITLWTDKMKVVQYYVDTDRSQVYDAMGDEMTENEAQEMIWSKIAVDIVRKIVKNFVSQ